MSCSCSKFEVKGTNDWEMIRCVQGGFAIHCHYPYNLLTVTIKDNVIDFCFMCGTVSSILSGLKTRSLGLNTLGTTSSPASSQSVQLGRPSTASWVQPVLSKVNVTCSRPQRNVLYRSYLDERRPLLHSVDNEGHMSFESPSVWYLGLIFPFLCWRDAFISARISTECVLL